MRAGLLLGTLLALAGCSTPGSVYQHAPDAYARIAEICGDVDTTAVAELASPVAGAGTACTCLLATRGDLPDGVVLEYQHTESGRVCRGSVGAGEADPPDE